MVEGQQDVDPAPEGFELYERYFVRVHGPHWREKRCRHNGYLCAYCRGAITTKQSEQLAALNTNPDWPGQDESHQGADT